MIKRNIILLFSAFLFSVNVFSQKIVEPGLVKWFTVEQADSLFEKKPKPILIDVYTDWCGWCKYMMKTTFANKSIAGYINQNFYPVRFNAETFDTVRYMGKTYINQGKGSKPKHDFAKYILDGRFSFPTIVYIDRNRKINPVPGYMDIKKIEPLLVYFSEDINLSINYDKWEILYHTNFSKVYKEEVEKLDSLKVLPDTSGILNFKSLKEASEFCLKNKKPLLIYFYTDWCYSCRVFEGVVLRNKVISDILNEKFNLVRFNAASENEEILFGDVFGGTVKGGPHKLTRLLLKQSFKFPALVFIDSDKNKLDEVHGFLSAEQLEKVLSYFSDGNYKTETFKDFLKDFKGKVH